MCLYGFIESIKQTAILLRIAHTLFYCLAPQRLHWECMLGITFVRSMNLCIHERQPSEPEDERGVMHVLFGLQAAAETGVAHRRRE